MAITHRSIAGSTQELLTDATKESTATAGQAGLVVVNPDGSTVGSASTPSSPTYVVGNVASAATDSGNPVKTGGKYVAAGITLTDGQRGDTQLDSAGRTIVSQGTLLAGEDLTNNRLLTEDRNTYAYINSATTTQVKSGAGFLKSITVNTTAAGTIGIIDNTSGTTVNIGQLKASVAEGTYAYNVAFTAGLRIVTGAASDITVSYR